MKLKKKYILVIVIFLIVAGISYYRFNISDLDSKEVRYITATAEKGILKSSILASGNIIVDNQATVDPTITGTVANLVVQVGDVVTKGQRLFTIINDDLDVSVSKALASYESAKNSVESAKIDKDSAEATYDKAEDANDEDEDAYSKKELSVLKDKIDLARAKIIQAQKSLDASLADYNNTRSDVSKRMVSAPISGTINEINIKNGDDLSRTSSNSITNAPIIIGDLETLKALVEVNEVDISAVSVGQKVLLKFDAMDSLNMSGTVEKIDALGTLTQGVVTYDVIIGFDSLDKRIKPQMSVSASIITDVQHDVLIIPSSAVKNDNNLDYVDVLNDKKVLQKKIVKVGKSNGIDTEILSGINSGDEVITQTIKPAVSNFSQNLTNNSGVRIPGMTGGSGGTRNFNR